MTRFTCTNCGYSVDSMHPGEKDLSCPGCRHRFEKDGEDGCEIQEHDHIFFEELMSGRTDEQFYPGELLELPARQGTQDRETAEVTERPRLQHRLRFKGSAGGYFRIWVGNVLLSVMTLGIFMLRSKKRVMKYFSDKIIIDGHPLASVTDNETIYEHITGRYPGNVVVGHLTIESTVGAGKLFWIRFSNILAGIVSFGLLIPWAKVRRVRYAIMNLTIYSDQKLYE